MDSKKFPTAFLWGTATSSHQVEGDNFLNDWWAWEQEGKNKPSGKACDQYHLYEQDFDLIKKMNNNAYRLSIEWSRIEPEEGKWNYKEIEHYKKVLQALKSRDIKVMLTLHHFTNPLWFAKKGGWERGDSPVIFSKFVEFVVNELMDYVDFWITLNEPVLMAMQSFKLGKWPPQKTSLLSYWKSLAHLGRAHKKAYKIIHNIIPEAKVGIAQNVISFPYERKFSLFNGIIIPLIAYYWNQWFFQKSIHYHDFLGLNYYFHYRLRMTLKGMRLTDPKSIGREVSGIGWEIYPAGFKKVISDFKKYNLPIYITENGLATDDEGQRKRFLVSYINSMHEAIMQGIDVRGYFYWSLLDNFEWEKGLGPRFGLVKVDFATQERSLTPAAEIYGQIAKENEITPELGKYIKED